MAFASIAALAAGEAATATLVLGAVAEVGTVLTVVGAVTGSKDLMKIGAVMGVVGGVGGMMAGATGAATDAASAAAENSFDSGAMQSLVDSAPSASTDLAASSATQTMGAAPDAVQSSPIINQVTQPAPLSPLQSTDVSAPQVASTTAPADTTATDTLAPPAPAAPAGAQTPDGAQGPADVSTPYSNPTDMRLANGTQTTPGAAPQDSGGFFSKFLTFAQKNDKLLASGMQLVGGALKGASEQSMWDQKMQLANAQFQRANSVGSFAPTTTGIVSGATR